VERAASASCLLNHPCPCVGSGLGPPDTSDASRQEGPGFESRVAPAELATNRSRSVRGQECPPIIGWHHVTPLMPPPTTSLSSPQGVVLLWDVLFEFMSSTRSQLLADLYRAGPTSTVPTLLCTLSTAPNPERQVSTIAATARDAFPTTARRRHPHLNNLLGLGAASRLMSA